MRRLRVGSLLIPVLTVAACAVGPDYEAPDLDLPSRIGDESAAPAPAPAPVPPTLADAWWQGFEDPTLVALVDRALTDNLDIAIGLARVREARAFVRAERSDLFPTVDGVADASVRTAPFSDARTGGSVGPVMTFVPDIFGGQRRRIEQARALESEADFTLADVRRLTVASVAEAYVDLRRNQARLDLLATSLDLQRQTLEIVGQRREAGLSSDLDVQRATADLARTLSQQGFLTAARTRAANALAVLLGEAPSALLVDRPEQVSVPVFVEAVPAGMPAAVVRNRPDVRAAEETLKAATAGIGVQVADLYPALRLPGNITASFGSAQTASTTVTAFLGAVLDIPLFDLGRRRAEIRVAREQAQVARLIYERTILLSLSEIESALADIEGFRQRRDALLTAIEASEKAFNQLNALYQEGLASFIDILDGQRTLIASREAFVDAEADLARAIIDLYRAVGTV